MAVAHVIQNRKNKGWLYNSATHLVHTVLMSVCLVFCSQLYLILEEFD